MIINLGCASVGIHIPWDDIFDYHPRRECNIYIICNIRLCFMAFWSCCKRKIFLCKPNFASIMRVKGSLLIKKNVDYHSDD